MELSFNHGLACSSLPYLPDDAMVRLQNKPMAKKSVQWVDTTAKYEVSQGDVSKTVIKESLLLTVIKRKNVMQVVEVALPSTAVELGESNQIRLHLSHADPNFGDIIRTCSRHVNQSCGERKKTPYFYVTMLRIIFNFS